MKQKYLVGIDEVGRGPLAGPVAVGVALVSVDFDWSLLPGVTDSKKLTPEKRGLIFASAKKLKTAGKLDYEVVYTSAAKIDTLGIVPAITKALESALRKVAKRHSLASQNTLIYLDGGLRAPLAYLEQETIIKGDLKVPIIGLASIIAKVTRDTYMIRLGKKVAYARYDFATHKGYGTKMHRQALVKYGVSPEHRLGFCRNFSVKSGLE